MIRTLRLRSYRGFKAYELRDLASVNLLVGRNNCGKTSILEAVELLASRGDPGVLVESMRRRGESHVPSPDRENPVRIDADGSLAWNPSAPRRSSRPGHAPPPIQFVAADSARSRQLAGLWDQVVGEGRDSEAVSALRIIQPDLKSIHFLSGDLAARTGGIVLGFEQGSRRVPIESQGDGMRRLLAVSLSLVRAAGGFLLIDEIDKGLHWTAMEGLWKLVVVAAMESDIQVFATTHSRDCIVGLASVLRDRPDLADAVSVQKIERQLGHAVSFGAKDIVTAADLGIELR